MSSMATVPRETALIDALTSIMNFLAGRNTPTGDKYNTNCFLSRRKGVDSIFMRIIVR